MCRWKSGARGCRRGSRASRQLRSAPLCLCDGKNPLGTRRKISTNAPPAQQSWPRPAVDGGTRARDGAMVGSTPGASALLRISSKAGQNWALPSAPMAVGCGAVNPSFGMPPRKPLHLPSSGSLVSAPRWRKLRLLRGNVRIWQGRISSDGGSGRTAVIYGAWHSHGYIHTHPHVSSSAFPALPLHNFWSGNIILVSGKSSSDC